MTIREALAQAAARLETAGVPDARLDAELLLARVLHEDRLRMRLDGQRTLGDAQRSEYDALIARRQTREPLQYIEGEAAFMGLTFRVAPGVLIPRQDTETLVEAALGLIKERGYRTVLDLCCGTGCIGISLAALSGAAVTLADISADALALARENAEKNGVCARVTETNLFSNIKRSFDLIACNPPYLSDADMAALQREVRFEPALALYGGADGLDFYRRIRTEYAAHLNPGGALLLEVGFGQAAAVCALFGENAYALRDLCGVERVVAVC